MSKDSIPNPGSNEAIKRGCTCPVLDNAHGRGRGVGKDGTPEFVMDWYCPLNGVNAIRGGDTKCR